jgi:hypothetical protein
MLGIGLSFDDWESIDQIDYSRRPDNDLQPRFTGLSAR